MTFSIIVASYGHTRWRTLGDRRALPTATAQHPYEVVRIHEPDGTVASARNNGAAQATGDWLVFLDADDELAPGYTDAMQAALYNRDVASLLLTPAVSYVNGRTARPPMFWPEVDLRHGNWLVIGTALPRSLFHEVGGFDDRPEYGAFEDWALWVKCWKAGAKPVKVPDAVYRAHVTADSRHRGASKNDRLGWHYAIGRDHFPDIYNQRWLARYSRTRPTRQELAAQRLARRQAGRIR